MSTRRNPRRAASKTTSLAEDGLEENIASSSSAEEGSSSSDEESVEELKPTQKRRKTSQRTSSRSTRFQRSMQEPRDSIRDLFDKNEGNSSPRKSPAKSHSSARRKVRTEVPVDSSEESSSEEEEQSDSELEEEASLKIQRIIASRSEPIRVWKEICANMHTTEIDYGSRWSQDNVKDDDTYEERFLVKWADLSYMHCSWETQQDLVEQIDGAKSQLSTFFRKSDNGLLFTADERCDGDYFDPAFVQIDRILEVHPPEGMPDVSLKCKPEDIVKTFGIILDCEDPGFEAGTGRQFLIKWKNTPYSNVTYEFERDLIINDIEYLDNLNALEERSKKPTKTQVRKAIKLGGTEEGRLAELFQEEDEEKRAANVKAYQDELAEQVFPNGGQLRDYQAEGVTWLASNFISDRSSILCDEMGLGKTLQTAAFIDLVEKKLHRRGPFLIVAPLSTIPHWQREFTSWTDLNTIVYHGSAKDREHIREMEFAFPCDTPKNGVGLNQSFLRKCMPKSRQPTERIWMAQVVITTPEMLVTDDFAELAHVEWEVLVVDEAHRLKNHNSRLAVNLRDRKFDFGHTLLLTGTPIQNNMTELWTLLNFIDPDEFDDLDDFLENYGDMKSKEKVDELHERIRPYILRRLKEDVEKSVPPKEETLIEVELTVLQKQYYRALYEKNVRFLHKNKSKALDGPSLSNLAMQLRKCCNHPFLLNGVEEDVRAQVGESGEKLSEGDFLVKASGKLVLLDKLLPRLKADGHRVLIFSQFKIMLDILEDYLAAREIKFERIDGSITGNKRQMAIDRFQSPPAEGKEQPLVMLLSTRAGGVGINLTAADTCIIFDSDWNPQNDLQAQARCHRIGQTKSVKIYRLLSRKTYEMQMFHMSSLKMGLDQAVLQGFESSGASGEGAMTKEEVERLLRHGAYDIFNEEKAGSTDAESNDFVQQDIDSILERRSKTFVHDNTGSNSNAAGGTFSKASFKAPKTPASGQGKGQTDDVDIDDPEFWKKMVGEAKVDDNDILTTEKKRKRTQADYSEKSYDQELNGNLLLSDASDDGSDSDSSDEDEWSVQEGAASPDSQDSTGLPGQPIKKLVKIKKERTKWGGSKANQWDQKDAQKLLKTLQTYGYGNLPWDQFIEKASIDTKKFDAEEVKRMCWSLLLFILREVADDDARNAKRREQRKAEKEREASEVETTEAAAKESGGVLGSDLGTQADQNDMADKLAESFKKLVDSNESWLSLAIQDATTFAGANLPRSKNALQRALRSRSPNESSTPQSLPTLFAANLWPSLKSRGWTTSTIVDGEFSGTICYSYMGKEYRSPHAVLVAVPEIHPQLGKIVENILASTGCTPDWNEAEILTAKSLALANISAESVTTFLDMFSPTQLLVDRRTLKKISFHRKVLNTCTLMLAAHTFVRQASTVPGPASTIEKLACGLAVNSQTGKPHPSWTSRHDAVLIEAIVKHGWIEHDSSCRAIADDSSIKWGAPFDDGDESNRRPEEKGISRDATAEPDIELLRATARGAAEFLNVEQDMIAETKGFDQSQVVKTYGLVVSPDEADSSLSSNRKWVVDDKLLLQNLRSQNATMGTNSGDGANAVEIVDVDVPGKKELLKRAKAILAKASFTARQPELKVTVPRHEFSTLDQSNPCNLLLAEIIRGLLRCPISSPKLAAKRAAKYLCSIAQSEARRLCDGIKKRNGENDNEAKELSKITGHIRLVGRTMSSSTRPAKNILRVILGEEPSIKAGEPTFPYVGTMDLQMSSSARVNASSSDTAAASKKVSASQPKSRIPKKDEAPAGNRALSISIAKAFDKNKETHGRLSDVPDPTTLELTASENLILTILCNQGLPVWNEDHAKALNSEGGETVDLELNVPGLENVILWKGVAEVVQSVAVAWVTQAADKLQRYRSMTVTDANRAKRMTDIQEAEREDTEKRRALAIAKSDVENPLKFAKKCILLLEAVRVRMGSVDTKRGDTLKKRINMNRTENYLGPLCLDWLKKDVARWAESLNLVDAYGRPLSNTVSSSARDGDDGFTLFAIMNRQHCRSVFGQIAQQTRARSIFVTYETEDVQTLVQRATSQVRNMGDAWDDQPAWWNNAPGSIHDYDLLQGLVTYGYTDYKEIFSSSQSFVRGKENYQLQQLMNDADTIDVDQDIHLTRKAVQIRVNQLTREMDSHISSLESLRAVGKKKDRGSDSVLSTFGAEEKVATGQTGIQAFFSSKPAASDSKVPASKKRDNQVLDLCDSDSGVEVVEPPPKKTPLAVGERSDSDVQVVEPAKRDSTGSEEVEVVSPPKQDVAAKRKGSPCKEETESGGSPEKKSKLV